jgi:hypothetical protein
MKTRLIIALFAIILSLVSCSKEEEIEETQPPVPNVDQLANLADKYYKMISSTSSPAYPDTFAGSSTNMYADYYALPCIQDDLRMFKSNGDLIYDNGPLRCSPLDSQVATGKWKFTENNTKIQVYNTSNSNTNDLKILINDGITLKYEMIVKYGSASFTWTETWKKM